MRHRYLEKGQKLTKDHFPRFIETTDDQVFTIEAVFGSFLQLTNHKVRFYNYVEERFYNPEGQELALKAKSPQLFKVITLKH